MAVFPLALLFGLVLLCFVLDRKFTPEDRRLAAEGFKAQKHNRAKPVGITRDGQQVFSIVGYTSDGRPVTADQIEGGVPPYSPKTNSLAVVALVLGVVAGPLAIPFGHIARSQIRETGEQGAGLALAGLILGYLSLASLIVVAMFYANLLV